MAGTARGKIDCISTTGNVATNTQEMFKNWYDFMEALVVAGVVQRIALQYGNAGTGVDFHDGANPFGRNAFAVYRFVPAGSRTKDWYILGQWSDNNSFGTAPGNPGLLGNSGSDFAGFGFSVASALESDGTTNANPWGGTINNNGTDTKSTPVWAAPVGGTLAVWPISNEEGNLHAASKQNMTEIIASGVTASNLRYGYVADNDNFFVYLDIGDNLNSQWFWFGDVLVRNNVDSKYPFASISDVGEWDFGAVSYGDVNGVLTKQGGFRSPRLGLMTTTYLTSYNGALTSVAQPSYMHGGVASFEDMPMYVYNRENLPGRSGMFGQIGPGFLGCILGVSDTDTNGTLTRYYVGESGTTTNLLTIPWDGTTTPRSTVVRTGVDF